MDEPSYKYSIQKEIKSLNARIEVLKQLLVNLQSLPVKNQLNLFYESKM